MKDTVHLDTKWNVLGKNSLTPLTLGLATPGRDRVGWDWRADDGHEH